jgi:hypothetical protein
MANGAFAHRTTLVNLNPLVDVAGINEKLTLEHPQIACGILPDTRPDQGHFASSLALYFTEKVELSASFGGNGSISSGNRPLSSLARIRLDKSDS